MASPAPAPVPARITGRSIFLTIGTTNYVANVISATLENEEADNDTMTFADASAGGGRDWTLKIKALQSTDPNSLWSFIWDHSGEEITFTMAPHGNATATANQPHFTGKATVPAKPAVGGEAGAKNIYTFEAEFAVIGEPTKKTT